MGASMANPAHVDILRQGVSVWNDWRRKNPEIVPDLTSVNLADVFSSSTGSKKSSARKAQVRLQAINLKGAQLDRAVIDNVDLREADLSGASLRFISAQNCDMHKATLVTADLTSANLTGADLSRVSATAAQFIGAKLNSANLNNANLGSADIRLANLTGASQQGLALGHQSAGAATGVRGLTNRLMSLAAETSHSQARVATQDSVRGMQAENGASSSAETEGRAVRFTGDLEHLAILRSGVANWNRWREEKPLDNPNLQGLNFSKELAELPEFFDEGGWLDKPGRYLNLANINLSGSNLKSANLAEAVLKNVDLSDSILDEATLSGAILDRCIIERCEFKFAEMARARVFSDLTDANFWSSKLQESSFWGNLQGTHFIQTDLKSADFSQCKFSNCVFSSANVVAADFSNAVISADTQFFATNLSDTIFIGARIDGADFSYSRIDGMNAAGIEYNEKFAAGKFVGVGGAAEVYGDIKFQQMLRDRVYIDTLRQSIYAEYESSDWAHRIEQTINGQGKAASIIRRYVIEITRFIAALFNGFATIQPAVGALIGLVLWAVIRQPEPKQFFDINWGSIDGVLSLGLVEFIVSFAVVFGLLGGWVGKRLTFWIWGLFDYGRQSARVLLFGLLMVLLFGFGYEVASPTHVSIAATDASQQFLLYPWYVAAMGFATLGIADLVEPVTGLGMLLILGNVLSGWLTLGLLISVMGDSFKQR
jgi:uncharacterized protein YjbI with pentapeptide repeats